MAAERVGHQSELAVQQSAQLRQHEAIAALTLQMQTAMEQLAAARSDSEQVKASASEEAKTKEEELRQLGLQLKALQAEVEQRAAAGVELRVAGDSSIASLTSQLEEKTLLLSTLQQTILSHQRETQKLEQSLASLTQSHSTSLAQLRCEVRSLSELSTHLSAQSASHAADAAQKAQLLIALEVEKEGLEGTLQRLRALYEKSLKAAGQSQKESSQVIAEYQQKVSEGERRLEDLHAVVGGYERGMKEQVESLETKERMIALLRLTIEESERSRQRLAEEIQQLQNKEATKEEERLTLQGRIEEVQSTTTQRETALTAVIAEHEMQMAVSDSLRCQQGNELKALQSRLDTAEAELAAVRSQAEEVKSCHSTEVDKKEAKVQQLLHDIQLERLSFDELEHRYQQQVADHAVLIERMEKAAEESRQTVSALNAQLKAQEVEVTAGAGGHCQPHS